MKMYSSNDGSRRGERMRSHPIPSAAVLGRLKLLAKSESFTRNVGTGSSKVRKSSTRVDHLLPIIREEWLISAVLLHRLAGDFFLLALQPLGFYALFCLSAFLLSCSPDA